MKRRASVPAWPLALAALLLAACAKPVPADRHAYVGHWRGDGVRLVIRADGQGDYEHVDTSGRLTVRGPVHAFADDGFRIGVGPMGSSFRVDQPPQLRDGRWRMVVDGRELFRVEILPVPAQAPSGGGTVAPPRR